jgi:NifU-like protein involved in Fe-S cluster formation
MFNGFGRPDRTEIGVEDEFVKDIKYRIKACPASVACASAMTELTMGVHFLVRR